MMDDHGIVQDVVVRNYTRGNDSIKSLTTYAAEPIDTLKP